MVKRIFSKRSLLFAVMFLGILLADFTIFTGLFSKVIPEMTSSAILGNVFVSLVILAWLLLIIPSALAYFIAFRWYGGRISDLQPTHSVWQGIIAAVVATLLLGGLVGGAYWFITPRGGFAPYSLQSITEDEFSTPDKFLTPTVGETVNLVTFTDAEVPGFSFQYDSEKWFVEKDEDLKYCSDVSCSPPHGRYINLTHKEYSKLPNDIFLSIVLSDNVEEIDDSNEICFAPADISAIGEGWYRAKSPHDTSEWETQNKLWTRYFYRQASIQERGNTKCIKGALNIAKQPLLFVKFQGKPLIADIELRNFVSLEFSNIADEIVKSLKF